MSLAALRFDIFAHADVLGFQSAENLIGWRAAVMSTALFDQPTNFGNFDPTEAFSLLQRVQAVPPGFNVGILARTAYRRAVYLITPFMSISL